MNKKYFYISILLTIVAVAAFFTGLYYGFTSEVFYIAKPITIFQYAAFLAFAFFVTSLKETLRKSPRKELYFILGFFVAMLSFYEILFNYFLWFSLYNLYGIGTSLDAIRNSVPYANITVILNSQDVALLTKAGLYPVSLNIASKLSTLIFFGALYWLYLVNNLRKDER
jgi:hypothetical protein